LFELLILDLFQFFTLKDLVRLYIKFKESGIIAIVQQLKIE